MIDYALADGVFRTPHGHDAVFRYRQGTNDWNTLVASLNEDEYGLRGYRPQNAVDVGGYLGSVGISIALDNPEARVLIVEPVPDNADLIAWAIDANGVYDRVRLVRGAVGDGSEVEVRYRYTGTEAAEHHAFVGNSSLAYDNGGLLPHQTVLYRSLTIADICDLAGEPDFLKIDTEGAEWAFLSTGVERLPFIVGEWHPVRGHTRADLFDLLSPTHSVEFPWQEGPDGRYDPIAGPGGFVAVRR